MEIRVERLDHINGAKKFCGEVEARNSAKSDPRRLEPNDFPDSAFITLDTVTLPTHMGTHIDAPVHYGPECEGSTARTVDELPLEWFYGDGVRLDLCHKKPGDFITVADLEAALAATGHELKPFDIVLIWTGTDKLWGKREYFSDAPGMSRDATEWLALQGIKVMGIDTYGFDRPFVTMLEDFWRTGDRNYFTFESANTFKSNVWQILTSYLQLDSKYLAFHSGSRDWMQVGFGQWGLLRLIRNP